MGGLKKIYLHRLEKENVTQISYADVNNDLNFIFHQNVSLQSRNSKNRLLSTQYILVQYIKVFYHKWSKLGRTVYVDTEVL